MLAAALIALVGVGVAAEISYVHSQIDALGDSYTSFCNVNSSINCDAVLSSRWATFFDIPIAWMALVAYSVLAGLFFAAWRAGSRMGPLLGLGAAGAIGAVVFSLYMAVVSTMVVGSICLLCTGLYVTAFALAAVSAAAVRTHTSLWPGRARPLTASQAGTVTLAALAVVAVAAWGAGSGEKTLAAGAMTLEEVRASDPDFYDWYMAQPVERSSALDLREDERGHAPVTLIDYSDFGCPSCRRNFELLEEVLAQRGDLVHVVHRHFPLDAKCNAALPRSVHPQACRAAEAAECARREGLGDELSAVLFENQAQLWESNLVRLAASVGVDPESFQKCLDEHATLDRVIADARSGARLELTSTPTLFLNGRRIVGTFESAADYQRAILIEAALAR